MILTSVDPHVSVTVMDLCSCCLQKFQQNQKGVIDTNYMYNLRLNYSAKFHGSISFLAAFNNFAAQLHPRLSFLQSVLT